MFVKNPAIIEIMAKAAPPRFLINGTKPVPNTWNAAPKAITSTYSAVKPKLVPSAPRILSNGARNKSTVALSSTLNSASRNTVLLKHSVPSSRLSLPRRMVNLIAPDRPIDQNVPITNYGTAIAYMQGILKRSIQVFPELTSYC